MRNLIIRSTAAIEGVCEPPPDKSISHRALICNSLFPGEATVQNLLQSEDVFSTMGVLRSLGVSIEGASGTYRVQSQGLQEAHDVLDCGNSGTTMRLMSGVLSAQPFFSVLKGDASLSSRPMGRIILPLRKQGVLIQGRKEDSCAPLAIRGFKGDAFSYQLPIPSAQVASSLMLYGLLSNGCTISKMGRARDHTERMFRSMGAKIHTEDDSVTLFPSPLRNIDICVPGDPSSAAFFIVAALICGSELSITGVGVNPTRFAFVETLRMMGADIEISQIREQVGEPIADLSVKKSTLRGIVLDEESIPAQVDEIPLLAVAAVFAEGETIVCGAQELRVKESDRIHAICSNLRKMGARIQELPDGFRVCGTGELVGAEVDSFGDHRIAMACAIAGLQAKGATIVQNSSCITISFPHFVKALNGLGANIEEVST